jgi:hypothetical protein
MSQSSKIKTLFVFGMQLELLQQQVDNLRRKVNRLSSISSNENFVIFLYHLQKKFLVLGENVGGGKSTNTVPSGK